MVRKREMAERVTETQAITKVYEVWAAADDVRLKSKVNSELTFIRDLTAVFVARLSVSERNFVSEVFL